MAVDKSAKIGIPLFLPSNTLPASSLFDLDSNDEDYLNALFKVLVSSPFL